MSYFLSGRHASANVARSVLARAAMPVAKIIILPTGAAGLAAAVLACNFAG